MQGTTIVKTQTFGAWLPNILAERDFTIAKSLNSIFWMTFASRQRLDQSPSAAAGIMRASCGIVCSRRNSRNVPCK